MSASVTVWLTPMSLSVRLIALRKERGLSQQALADAIGIHVNQVKRYETSSAQPSLEALKRIAKAFSVSTDWLLFEEAERGPDEQLRLQFEALSAMSAEEQAVARAVLDAMIVKNQVAGALARVSQPAKAKSPARRRGSARASA
jgi:transcriptional regulator with XRE-family HTH domain